MDLAIAPRAGGIGTAGSTNGEARRPLIGARATLAVENMNCGGCMRKIERVLEAHAGVIEVRANLSAKRVSVGYQPNETDVEGLVKALAGAGYRAADLALRSRTNDGVASDRDLLRRLAVAGFATANVMLLSVSVWAGLASDMDHELRSLFHWLSAMIALPAVLYAGQPFFRSALTALSARHLNMDVPISLALILASAMSLFQTIRGGDQVYFDAGISLTFFLLIGRYLDQSLRSHAQGAAQNLLGLKSGWATVLDGHGATRRLAARDLESGMVVLVAAGERIPVDGRVRSGSTDVDEQLMTGETVPRSVGPGALVLAGTVALTAPLEIEATATDEGTLIAEIARLMEAAEQSKGRYVRLADRAARIYSPAVHILGAATFIGWMIAGAGWEAAMLPAIAVLIITCPCALALAVPAVQVAAVSRLFEAGVIMTAPDGLERLAEIDTVVLDKTGTLTEGEPELATGFEIDDAVLGAAAALAASSRHPYARAVVRAAERRGLAVKAVAGVTEKPGAGLSRFTETGTEERLGSSEHCGVAVATGETGGDGAAVLWYRPADGGDAVALRFVDRLRSDAADTVARLEQAGLQVILVSGDRASTVAAAAREAGIADYLAGQKPHEKIAALEALAGRGRRVLMVGDGLNDAPALAAAHASLSPAAAVDISQLASDGIIQGGRLGPILDVLAVARRSRRMCFENFAIALAYNAVCVPLAMAGFVTPLIAAIAMSTSSIVVTANALRLRGARVRLAG
ncbi:MAG: heavy metal translocating P-type ATPase [Rhizobiales bacterium]|nr:heavy metal translocating P-type ATPase [Hyphomicrobiales bacterium]